MKDKCPYCGTEYLEGEYVDIGVGYQKVTEDIPQCDCEHIEHIRIREEEGPLMKNHIHMKFWIKELHSYGIHAGPNGERLEDMEYYALRGYLVKMQMQRDLEPMHSRWF